MREIKFRVWNGLNMEYKIMAGYLGAFYVAGIHPNDSASMSTANTIYSEQTPVMQYTGLKDKNGKDIYEGDILKFNLYNEHGNQGKHQGEVIYDTENVAFEIFSDHSEMGFGKQSKEHFLAWAKNIEVIGNIYEKS